MGTRSVRRRSRTAAPIKREDAAAWTLRLLDQPALVTAQGVAHPLERRAAALFALAALEPGLSRHRVAALLWPDSDESTARQALRQQLLRLRKLCGGELLAGEGVLRLAERVRTDVAGESARGRLLGAFDYDDSDELARWVEQARSRLHEGMVQRLAGSIAAAEAAGDVARAIAAAEQLVACDETSERAHRELVRLQYLSGDVGRALAAYERLCAMLQREYGAMPSAETEQLARTIRAAARAPRPSAPAASVMRPPRLIGRQREWQVLEACWAARETAVVTGAGGMGKTRLLGDFAASRGIASVAARPGDAFAPYSVLARLARMLLARSGASAVAGGITRELARLLPELGEAPPPRDLADRARLAPAIEALVRAAADAGLEGVALDDLHHADAASIEMLQGSVAAGESVRWILACRDEELGAEGRALLDSLAASGVARTIDLTPLAPEHVRELLESLQIPGFEGESLAAAITRHTGGNPLFVLETVKAMLLEGDAAGAAPRLPAAPNVTALIARRLGRLSPPALRLARCAAVAGQDFSAQLAAQVLGVRPLDLADAWTELEHAHVLQDGAFEHDLVHEAALASVPGAIARRMHAEIAAVLEAGAIEPARVAAHWLAGRRPLEASGALMRAASRAKETGRRVEEAALLQEAAECFARCGQPAARFEALLARAQAMICNDLGAATAAAVEAAEKAARSEDERARALLCRADYLNNRSEPEAAIAAAREGLAIAEKAGLKDLAALFAVVVAGCLCELRRVEEAIALLEPLGESVVALPARARVEYLIQLGIAQDLANRLSQALGSFHAAREIAAREGLKDVLATALSNLATTTSKRGELARAVEYGRQGLQLWRESEALRGTPFQTQALLAHRLRDIGHYDEAIAMMEEALAEFRRAGARHWIFATAHRLALAYAHVGQHARASKLLGEEPEGLPTKAQAMWMAHRGETARFASGSAIAPIRAALALLGEDVDDGNNRLVSLFAAAVLPPTEGESIATATAAWATARERLGMAIAAHVRSAACALAAGAAGRAQPHVEAALRLFSDHEPDNFYRAELWWVAAQAFRAAGQGPRADRMLAEGRDWVRDIAARHVRPEYRDSFLHRNWVNRALLSAAARLD